MIFSTACIAGVSALCALRLAIAWDRAGASSIGLPAGWIWANKGPAFPSRTMAIHNAIRFLVIFLIVFCLNSCKREPLFGKGIEDGLHRNNIGEPFIGAQYDADRLTS